MYAKDEFSNEDQDQLLCKNDQDIARTCPPTTSARRIGVLNKRCKVLDFRSMTNTMTEVINPKMENCTMMPEDDCAKPPDDVNSWALPVAFSTKTFSAGSFQAAIS